MSRIAFFRGYASVKGQGYDPVSDVFLPRSWLRTFMMAHLNSILDGLSNPETLVAAEIAAQKQARAFKLTDDFPTYRGRELDKQTLSEQAYSDGITLDDTFRTLCIAAGKYTVPYLSNVQSAESTMRFAADPEHAVSRVFYLHTAETALPMPPGLRKSLLTVLEHMLNVYDDPSDASGFIAGLRDTCDNPMVWRAAVRKDVYALSAKAMNAIEPDLSASRLLNRLESELRKSSQKLGRV